MRERQEGEYLDCRPGFQRAYLAYIGGFRVWPVALMTNLSDHCDYTGNS